MLLTLEHKHWYHFVLNKKEPEEMQEIDKKKHDQQNGGGVVGGGESSSWSFLFQLPFTQKQSLEKRKCWRFGKRSDASTKPRR